MEYDVIEKTSEVFPVCHCCGSTEILKKFDYPFSGKDPKIPDLPKQIIICSVCESAYAYPSISAKSLISYYENEKSPWGDIESYNGPKDFPVHYALSASRWNYIRKHVKKTEITVLDVGAGCGAFGFAVARSTDPAVTTYIAQDLDQKMLQRLNKYWPDDIICHLETLSILKQEALNSADLVVLSHVIEHMRTPAADLSDLISFTKKDALFFIEVPHLDFRFKKYPFPHLTFFSKNGLIELTKRLKLETICVDVVGGDVDSSMFNVQSGGWKKISEGLLLRFRKLLPSAVLFNGLAFIYRGSKVGRDGPWLRMIARKSGI